MLKFFCEGKTTWPDKGLETQKLHNSMRREKALEKLHEIKLQNSLGKWILGFFLFLLALSLAAIIVDEIGIAFGLLVAVAFKSPLIGFCLYLLNKNKKFKRKLISLQKFGRWPNGSLSSIYDWNYCKCRYCGSNDFAEIQSDMSDFSPELEKQIRKGDMVLRCIHHGNAALQCNGCGKWGYNRKRLDKKLDSECGYNVNSCGGYGSFHDEKYLPMTNRKMAQIRFELSIRENTCFT